MTSSRDPERHFVSVCEIVARYYKRAQRKVLENPHEEIPGNTLPETSVRTAVEISKGTRRKNLEIKSSRNTMISILYETKQ